MRLLRALRGTLVVLSALLLAGCAGEYPQSTIDPVTDFGRTIHDLYALITWITAGILAVVLALLGYVLVRFRERPDSPHPRQIHGHLGMEVAWTIIPAVLVVAIAVPTIRAVFATQRGDPENAMVVDVVGNQFWWEFRYPEAEVVTANELHLPVGVPISLRLHSNDVIHSFWVPQLGGKRDVNPRRRRPQGEDPRYTWLHFTIEEPGVYMGQCAEFCGEAHSLMGVRVVAQSVEDFGEWLEDWKTSVPRPARATAEPAEAQGADTVPVVLEEEDVEERSETEVADLPDGLDPELVAEGRDLFMNNTCISCHAIAGTNARGRIGPNLTLLGRRSTIAAGWLDNSVENLVRWIAAPHDIKPGAKMPGADEPGGNFPPTNLTEDQVLAVAQYLYSLR